MKNIKKIITLVLALTLVIGSLATLASCKPKNAEPTSVSIDGDKNISISLGESVTFSVTVDPADAPLTWRVEETNLGDEYILDGSTFTAKQVAGYAVIMVSTPNGLCDRVTVVINRDYPVSSQGYKVTFYATDGVSVIDIRYADKNGKVSVPSYSVSDKEFYWLNSDGVKVDPTTVTITADTFFTAKAALESVYYTIKYWYYSESGDAIQAGETFCLDYANGETVSPEALAAINSIVESATGKQIVNWRCELSSDGLAIDWYAELK